MILQLAEHFIRPPRGIVEDVLIKVGDFIFLVDFVVLETKLMMSPENEIPIILGPSFLTTSNALINYQNEKNNVDI